MATAHASVSLKVNVENPSAVIGDLLLWLNDNLLKPKSMQMNLVGSGSFEKIGHSLDGDCVWPRHELPAALPGEREVPQTRFTTLERPDEWFAVPRDIPKAVERLRSLSEKSVQLWKSKKTLDDDVFWTFWGLTKIFYTLDDTSPKAEYFLREKLQRGGTPEPVLRVIGHLTQMPRPSICVRFLIRGFVWSHHSSVFDEARQEWISKSDLCLEQVNARLFAETLIGFVQRHPDGEVEWETDQEHSPDLRGFIPSELRARLGPPSTRQRIGNLETSK